MVEAVGQGVEAALVGLRVWLWEAAHGRPSGGTAQELAVLPARHVVLLPDVASFDLGASLGVEPAELARAKADLGLTVTVSGVHRFWLDSPDTIWWTDPPQTNSTLSPDGVADVLGKW